MTHAAIDAFLNTHPLQVVLVDWHNANQRKFGDIRPEDREFYLCLIDSPLRAYFSVRLEIADQVARDKEVMQDLLARNVRQPWWQTA